MAEEMTGNACYLHDCVVPLIYGTRTSITRPIIQACNTNDPTKCTILWTAKQWSKCTYRNFFEISDTLWKMVLLMMSFINDFFPSPLRVKPRFGCHWIYNNGKMISKKIFSHHVRLRSPVMTSPTSYS